ncbi:MAG: PilZ domain-containing protein [Desulfobacterales bacterium]|nr:MAG: PilZ domain-containing protein [Desulfobacterales bacterium]
MKQENRRYPRINVKFPIFYDCYDEDGQIVEQNIGLALDVSLGGILIETNRIMDANYIRVGFVNYQNKIVETVGSIAHSRKCANGKVKTGICFHGRDSESRKFATDLIRTYNYGK